MQSDASFGAVWCHCCCCCHTGPHCSCTCVIRAAPCSMAGCPQMICDSSCADSVALCKHVGKMLAHGVVNINYHAICFFKHGTLESLLRKTNICAHESPSQLLVAQSGLGQLKNCGHYRAITYLLETVLYCACSDKKPNEGISPFGRNFW